VNCLSTVIASNPRLNALHYAVANAHIHHVQVARVVATGRAGKKKHELVLGLTTYPNSKTIGPDTHVVQVYAVALTRGEFTREASQAHDRSIPGYSFSGYVVSAPVRSRFKSGNQV
jgi:hypothetical protein